MKCLALVIVSAVLAGCVTTQQAVQPTELGQPSAFSQFLKELAGPGPGLAAHDPPQGQLFDQIPAWDNAAEKRCCSVLSRSEFIKMKCDTDQPVYPRTNRC